MSIKNMKKFLDNIFHFTCFIFYENFIYYVYTIMYLFFSKMLYFFKYITHHHFLEKKFFIFIFEINAKFD